MINIDKELFKNFLDNKIVINCETEEEAIEFFKYCDSQNIIWAGGNSLLEYTNWNSSKKETCYDCNNMEIQYNNKDYYIYVLEKDVVLYRDILEKLDTYTGWQILKMIDEGKLKEKTIIIWHNGEDIYQEEFVLRNDRCLYSIRYHKEASISYFINTVGQGYFTIEEKEYITFNEARKSGKRFKYKKWNTYEDLLRVLWYLLYKHSNEEANNMLDEKAWEVED